MSDVIDPKVVQAAYERLSEKMYRWLFQQPEWVLVLASPRNVRKDFARDIADHVTRIPTFVTNAPAQPPAGEEHDNALD
jgi:hypothetical protein